MPESCGACKTPSPTTGYLPEEPGKQTVWSQKRDKRKPGSWGHKCRRHSGFWMSSPDSSIQVDGVTVAQNFPTWTLPHSFKPNLNNQAHYSPSTSLICQGWFCRTGMREHSTRSSPGEKPMAEELQQPLSSSGHQKLVLRGSICLWLPPNQNHLHITF